MLSRDDTLSRQLVVLLRRLAKPNERSTKIRQFQDTVWSSTELILDETVDRSLRDVAYYLDIYESDSARRAEDQSLHAVTKLQAVIREALAGLALTLRRDCTT